MKLDHLLSSYDYYLPKELIAQGPAEKRDHSRLMVYDHKNQKVSHHFFYDLPNFLPPESSLLMNQSKVFPCRLKVTKKNSHGSGEIFFLDLIPVKGLYQVLIKSNSKKKIGDEYVHDRLIFKIIDLQDKSGVFAISITSPIGHDFNLSDYLNLHALTPIPPYIKKGEATETDKNNYQTIYAKSLGSVAAPTAGLHFTTELLEQIKLKHQLISLTLHVSLGTFKNIEIENLTEHQMHYEKILIDEVDAKMIKNNLQNVICVGTTSLRTLTHLYQKYLSHEYDFNHSWEDRTNIFIYPGCDLKIPPIKGLLTNFHLPKSSLLVLVSALVGREKALELYHQAISERYRFFSYGDAMLILL
jgi:S-adenosylmethionine:tRNA ribosyltransferase-isomerase